MLHSSLKAAGRFETHHILFAFAGHLGLMILKVQFAMVLMLIWNGREPFIFTENGPTVVHESTLPVR